jgi:hypothetical protein
MFLWTFPNHHETNQTKPNQTKPRSRTGYKPRVQEFRQTGTDTR